jgi:hypothetical protein
MNPRRALIAILAINLSLFGLRGCGTGSDGEPDGDGGGGPDGPLDKCQVDNSASKNTDPEWQLQDGGDAKEGWICPKGDIDYFWFEVDTPRTIVAVDLHNNVTLSPVDLCYDLYYQNEDIRLSGLCDPDGIGGVTELEGTHYLERAGTYDLLVRDQGGDDEDPRKSNKYMLSIQMVADPDTYEPNNTKNEAKTLGAASGFISYLGDEDWYQIDVGAARQIVSVDLTTSGSTPVDLHYLLLEPDGVTPVNEGSNFNGMDGATALHDVLPCFTQGTFYLVVSDLDDDDSDLEVGYSLSVNVQTSPDSVDPKRETPYNAVEISSGQNVTGRYFDFRGDEDWYKITSPGTTDSNPALLEIDIEIPGSSTTDPAVDLIVPDPHNECVDGVDSCETLEWNCARTQDCNTAECIHARCPSHECFIDMGKCTGAGWCLQRASGGWGCGIRSLVMHGADWSRTGSARHLHTVAPMYGDTYYLLVRDFPSRDPGTDVDIQNAYSFTATVHQELDSWEPNGLYNPYATNEEYEDTRDWNRGLAKNLNCTTDASGLTCPTITGYLSYRGDQDWYKFSVPREAEEDPATMGPYVDWDMQFEWSFSGNSAMEINYTLYGGNRMGFVAGTGSGTFGDDECAYYCGEYHTPATVYLVVQHKDRKEYDYQNPYVLTIRGLRDCPLDCSYCQADCTNYPCPNPRNPNPSSP